MSARLFILFLILFASFGSTRALAQDGAPERIEAFVYATTHYDGLAYNSALVTPDAETVYLLANRESVIAPRDTLIYFWPLTQRYLADWRRKNELVEGTLEILQNGQVIEEIPLTTFVVQYDNRDILNTVRLLTGVEAERGYEAFERMQQAYRETLEVYFRAQTQYELELREIVRSNEPGTVAPEDLPPEPVRPPAPTLFSTDPIQGYVVSLPEGEYTMRLRLPDGSIHPDSEKRLVTYDALRQGVAYQVTPKSRWTVPEEAREPDSTIYAQPGEMVYLRPYSAAEYNARAYTLMQEPQEEAARADRTLWALHQPMTAATARISVNSTVETAELSPYYVRQLGSDARGYDIIPWDETVSEQASFTGFQVNVPAGGVAVIELVDESGNVIPGSRREIRPLATDRAWVLYVAGALPLALGAFAVFSRRGQTRRLKQSDITA